MTYKSDLAEAYELHRMDIVSRLVAYHGVDMSDAEDALQDVVLRLLEKWEASQSTLKNWVPGDLPHFLFVATHDKCKGVMRRERRRAHLRELYFGNT